MPDADDVSGSGSGSESEDDIAATGLIATRAKRSTAGNLYASLRANLDDEDVRRDLLAEDEDDVGDYEGSDRDADDDDALESSSDEEDAGPPKEGDAEDLEGEKELKKAERKEARQKRKAQDAKLKVPVWSKKRKVRLADDVKAEDGGDSAAPAAPKPKKKSERSNWLPTPADAPVRQSGRALAVANREITHANLQQSLERSERQRKVMANAAERGEKFKKRMVMSSEDRLAACGKIAKQTDREFGRWEREEAERQKARDEALAAKRRRGMDGPYVRYWSGSAIWRGLKMEEERVEHGSKTAEELKDKPPEPLVAPAVQEVPSAPTLEPDAGPSWLQGIQEYASQPVQPPSTAHNLPQAAPAVQPIAPQGPVAYHIPPTYTVWPPGSLQSPAPPLLREQAQRSLIMLDQFDHLELAPGKKPKAPTNALEPSAPATVLLPDSYPSFNSDESRYLLSKYGAKKKHDAENIPPAPEKTKCAIIPNKDAKYRDPKTGLPYLDMQSYKIIQRVLAGGCQWSGLLGAWVGPSYGAMGRPARNVPEGFGTPAPATAVKVEAE